MFENNHVADINNLDAWGYDPFFSHRCNIMYMNEIGSFSKGCKVISTVLTQVKSGKTKARVKGKMEA